MKAEILFPEVCNLYGDLQNIYYLKRCCPALEIIETDLHSKPRFLTEDVALVYMGSTTEQGLRLAADALRPYAADIAARADAGQLILLTGNAPDVFSAAIESDSADTIEGLDILPGRVRYTMMKRHNSFFLGTFDGMEASASRACSASTTTQRRRRAGLTPCGALAARRSRSRRASAGAGCTLRR